MRKVSSQGSRPEYETSIHRCQLKRPPPTVTTERLVGEVLPRMRELDRLELIVVDPFGTPVTVLRVGDLAVVATAARWTTTIGELAARIPARHIVVPWDISANDAIERASEASALYVIVLDPAATRPDDLVGLVTAEDIVRMVKLQMLARLAGPRPPGSAPPVLRSSSHRGDAAEPGR